MPRSKPKAPAQGLLDSNGPFQQPQNTDKAKGKRIAIPTCDGRASRPCWSADEHARRDEYLRNIHEATVTSMEEEYGTQRYWDMRAIINETTLSLLVMESVIRERAYVVAAETRADGSKGETSNDLLALARRAARNEHRRRLAAIKEEWQVIRYNRFGRSGLVGLRIKDGDGEDQP